MKDDDGERWRDDGERWECCARQREDESVNEKVSAGSLK